MGCKQLQLSDYFRLTKSEYSPTKYRAVRFTQRRMRVPPRQNDSLKGLSYSRIDYDYHISGQIATATQVGTALDESVRTSYEWDGLALIRKNNTSYTNEPAVMVAIQS